MSWQLFILRHYIHELNIIQVRSRDRITAHASASLWRAQLQPWAEYSGEVTWEDYCACVSLSMASTITPMSWIFRWGHMTGSLRMRQPLYGEHNYSQELNIQVRSHDRISAHVCWFPVYTGSVSGKHSQTYKTPHLGTYPLRHIYLSFVYISVSLTRRWNIV